MEEDADICVQDGWPKFAQHRPRRHNAASWPEHHVDNGGGCSPAALKFKYNEFGVVRCSSCHKPSAPSAISWSIINAVCGCDALRVSILPEVAGDVLEEDASLDVLGFSNNGGHFWCTERA